MEAQQLKRIPFLPDAIHGRRSFPVEKALQPTANYLRSTGSSAQTHRIRSLISGRFQDWRTEYSHLYGLQGPNSRGGCVQIAKGRNITSLFWQLVEFSIFL